VILRGVVWQAVMLASFAMATTLTLLPPPLPTESVWLRDPPPKSDVWYIDLLLLDSTFGFRRVAFILSYSVVL